MHIKVNIMGDRLVIKVPAKVVHTQEVVRRQCLALATNDKAKEVRATEYEICVRESLRSGNWRNFVFKSSTP